MNYLKKIYIYFLLCIICFSSSGSEKNYYEILSVSNTADQEEITKAYRQLAFKHHPDRNIGDETAHEKMVEINSAYSVLRDPQQRQEYDQLLPRLHNSTRAREQYERQRRELYRYYRRYYHYFSMEQHHEIRYYAIMMDQHYASMEQHYARKSEREKQRREQARQRREQEKQRREQVRQRREQYERQKEQYIKQGGYSTDKGVDINKKIGGFTFLQLATMHGLTKDVEAFIKAGADLEVKTKNGWTALHLAVRYNNTDAMRILVSAGADLEAKTNESWTALHLAARYNNTDAMRILLSAGADPKAKDNKLITPLMSAKARGKRYIFRQEIRKRRKARFQRICQSLFGRLTQ